jgi:hypothetical protein
VLVRREVFDVSAFRGRIKKKHSPALSSEKQILLHLIFEQSQKCLQTFLLKLTRGRRCLFYFLFFIHYDYYFTFYLLEPPWFFIILLLEISV